MGDMEGIIRCDYRHDGSWSHISDVAEWVLVGESGDFYVCGWHFDQRTEAGKRGWRKLTYEVR